jgi:hypothetical protein
VAYKDEIEALADKISTLIVDFSLPRVRGTQPTQASSEFITNREQGDWAERLILQAVNETNDRLVAVQYGKSDSKVAGEPGFEAFYQEYQDELDRIGKRPDLLIFKVEDYDPDWSFNISQLPEDILAEIVPKAVAGLEIRSSSFLIGEYDRERSEQLVVLRTNLFRLRDQIISEYSDILPAKILDALSNADEDNLAKLSYSYRLPAAKQDKHVALAQHLAAIRVLRDKIHKTRGHLSFTAKAEDLYIVRKWVQTYNVPHYYFQVFFDRVYGIAFEHILDIISNPSNFGTRFTIERNVKNQFKTTIHMNVKEGREVAYKVTMPHHKSEMKRLPRGRLLFHVTFEGGEAFLNLGTLYSLLHLQGGGA